MEKQFYCGTCGEETRYANGSHVCAYADAEPEFCEECGAELTDNGSCDNDHGPDVPDGLQKRDGVEIGCGKATCQMCYEALKALRDNVENDMSGYWTESTANLMQQADEAIAKAEGR